MLDKRDVAVGRSSGHVKMNKMGQVGSTRSTYGTFYEHRMKIKHNKIKITGTSLKGLNGTKL